MNDTGCTSRTDTSERQAGGAQCDDGIDNDTDGTADYIWNGAGDLQCTSAADTNESS
jgi:hypothetical protein